MSIKGISWSQNFSKSHESINLWRTLIVECDVWLKPIHFVCTLTWDASPCRQKRLAEWKATQMKNVFGEVGEISGQDYIKEVNKAGDGIWVVLHLYKQG